MHSKKNVAIYVRESRDDGFENYETIETQKSLLLDFVKKNEIGKVVGIYEDDNISGSTFDRPGLDALKRDVNAGLIDVIVIKDLSRLGRNNAKTLMFLDFLEEKCVDVITSDGRFENLKENDIIGIESWINERYVKDISVKIRQTLRHKIERGEYVGNAPYGYVKHPSGNNTLIIDEETSEIVKEIFNLYIEGRSYKYISDLLNSRKIPSPGDYRKKGSKWSPSTIMRILSNPVYLGNTIQGVSERISYKSRKSRKLPPSRWVITNNTHEPIISKEIFQKAAKIRKMKRSGIGNNKGRVHILKNILYCGNCSSLLYARYRNDRPMGYSCGNYMKNGSNSCLSHFVRESDIVSFILRDVLALLSDEEAVMAACRKLDEEPLNPFSIKKYHDKLAECKRKLNGLLRQQETLYYDRLEERISIDLFNNINQGLEEKISNCKKEIEYFSKKVEEVEKEGEGIYQSIFIKIKVKLESYINASDANEFCGDEFLREIILLLVNKIIVYEEGEFPGEEGKVVEIEYKKDLQFIIN